MRRIQHPVHRLALATVAAVALAACGSSNDQDKISALVQTIEKHPTQLCSTNYATAAFVQAVGGTGSCLRQANAAGAGNAKIGKITVSGASATADGSDSHGPFTIKLVKQGGNWRVSVVTNASGTVGG